MLREFVFRKQRIFAENSRVSHEIVPKTYELITFKTPRAIYSSLTQGEGVTEGDG